MPNAATLLFGGAIFLAGTAHAQEFVFVPDPDVGFATCAKADGGNAPSGPWSSATDCHPEPMPAYAQVAYGGAGGHAVATGAVLSAEAFATPNPGPSYGYASTAAHFTVTEPAWIRIAWDFGPALAHETDSYIRLTDSTPGAWLFIMSAELGSGQTEVFVQPGPVYHLYLAMTARSPSAGSRASAVLRPAFCFADCDHNNAHNVDDIECFVNAFINVDLANADCTADGGLNVDDVECFVDAFLTQCD